MDNKKFIMTKDSAIAHQMIAHKFKLISAIAGVYTFVNEPPKNFSFETFDMNKLHFTNKLSM